MPTSSNDQTTIGARDQSNAIGLKLIVGYKLVKAIVELLIGLLFLLLGSADLTEDLRVVALDIRHHAVGAWSIALAERLVRAATERNLQVAALAISLDGVVSFIEGWALHRRYRWSRWLIVGTTSCLLPFEGIALFRHLSVGRIALLFVNVLIVIYLIQRKAENRSRISA